MKTKRIFREWQHPRASNGRFARKGSPEWVKAAAEKFRNAPGGLKAGTNGPGQGTRTNRPQLARGAKAEALFAKHDAGVTTRLAPHQPTQGPAAPPKKTARPSTFELGAKSKSASGPEAAPLRKMAAPGARKKAAPAAAKGPLSDATVRGLSDEQLANGIKMNGSDTPKGRQLVNEEARRAVNAKSVDTPRDTAKTGGMSTTDAPALSPAQRSNYDKLLGNGPGEGLVKHKQSRQIVEQLEQHGWTLEGNAPTVGLMRFKAPDGRELGVQFLVDQYNSKPRFFTGSDARGRDLSYKAALAHVVTPTHEEVGSGGIYGARKRLGLPEIRDNSSDHTLKPFQDANRAHTGYGTMRGPTKNTSEVAADLRKAAENNRSVADHRAEYNRGVNGQISTGGEDENTRLLRQRADEFAAVADEMEKMDRERAAYVAERDRRAALPLDIRPTPRTGPAKPARPAKKAAAPKTGMEAVSDRIGEQRGLNGVEIPLDRKARTGLSDQALRKADRMAAEQNAPKANPLGDDILDQPGDIRAVVDAIKAVPASENGATAYSKMDRTTLVVLVRQAGISTRGKSNSDLAAALKAKDDERRAAKAAKLTPQGLGVTKEPSPRVSPVAAAAAQRATAPKVEAPKAENLPEGVTPAMLTHYMGLSDRDLARQASSSGIDTTGMSKRQIALAVIMHALGFDKRMREQYRHDAGTGRSEDVGNFTTGYRSEIGDAPEVVTRRPKGEAAKVAAPEAPKAPVALPTRKGARKGDLVVVERTTSDYVQGKGSQERTDYHVAVVTSVDKEGVVQSYSTNADGSYPQKVDRRREKTFAAPAEAIDVPAMMAAADAHTYPDSTTRKGFDSLDEVKALARQHRGDQAEKLKAVRAAAPKGRDPLRLKVGDRVTVAGFRRSDPATTAEVIGEPEAFETSRYDRGTRVKMRVLDGPNAGKEGYHTYKKSDKAQVLPAETAPAAASAPAAPARTRISPAAKRGALAKLDTSRDKSQTGGVSNAPTTEANVKITNAQEPYTTGKRVEVRTQNFDKPGFPMEWAPGTVDEHRIDDNGRVDMRVKLDRGGFAGRQIIGQRGGNKNVRPVGDTSAKAAVGDRPRTGTFTGEIKADRKERLNDKAFTDHVITLTLTANTGDEAKAWGFDYSNRPLQVGDEVMVDTFDRLRRGIVTHVTRDGKGNARVAYATPTGGYVQETTSPHAAVWQLVDPTKRPRENRAALLPKIAPEARGPRRMTDEEKAASKVARAEAEKVAAAERRQRFFDEKINGVTAALKGEPNANTPEWHLQLTTEEGLVSLAKHLGVKVPNRQKGGLGHPLPRDRDALRKSIIEAIQARMPAAPVAPAPRTTAPAGDSISRHVDAPISVDIFENGAGQLDIGPVDNRTVYDIHRDGGKWHADLLEGPAAAGGEQHSADTVADLARRIADAHGVSGTVSIEDERAGGRSLTKRFEHAGRQRAVQAPTVKASDVRASDVRASDMVKVGDTWGVVLAKFDGRGIQADEVQVSYNGGAHKEWVKVDKLTGHESRKANAAAAQAPIPVGANDADRARLRPRREGESDLAYSVRTAPSDFAAEGILKGHNQAGLRAIARAEGVTVPAGATKPEIISRLLEAMRRRDRDARAVGQDTTPNRTHADLVHPEPAPVPVPKPNARPAEKGRTELSGGVRGKTELVEYADGTKSVRKKIWHSPNADPEEQADVEELTPHIMAVVGVDAPAVRRIAPDTIDMDYVPGKTGMAFSHESNNVSSKAEHLQRQQEIVDHLRSDDAKRIGLVDLLTDNYDRNPGNWIIDGDGRMRPIDNGAGFETVNLRNVGPPQNMGGRTWGDRSYPWDNYGSPTGRAWVDNDLTPADIAEVRRRLFRLRDEFVKRGRSEWYEFMFKRLEQIAPYAKGTRNLIAGGAA